MASNPCGVATTMSICENSPFLFAGKGHGISLGCTPHRNILITSRRSAPVPRLGEDTERSNFIFADANTKLLYNPLSEQRIYTP